MESESDDSRSAAGAPANPSHGGGAPREDVAEAFRGHIDDLVRGTKIYVNSQIDLVKATVRRGVVFLAIGILALLALLTIFITAVVLLCLGISDAISQATGRHWAGELAVGIVVVGGTALGVLIGMKMIERQATRRAAKKYEQMNRREKGNGSHHD
jgi:hypothetical protein